LGEELIKINPFDERAKEQRQSIPSSLRRTFDSEQHFDKLHKNKNKFVKHVNK